jgi:hypothetical protein
MLPAPFPRLPMYLVLPQKLGGLDAQGFRQLPHRPGMRPLPAVLYSPDRVVGDPTPLLQLPQGENSLPPQFLEPLYIDLQCSWDTPYGGPVSYRMGLLVLRVCASVCGSFLFSVSRGTLYTCCWLNPHRYALLRSSKVLATRAAIEVSVSHFTLLEEEDGEALGPPSTSACAQVRRAVHVGASHGFGKRFCWRPILTAVPCSFGE